MTKTAFAEKLQQAGADTTGAQLIAALTEGIRQHPENVVEAWRHAGTIFGYELVHKLMQDMHGERQGKEPNQIVSKSPPPPTDRAPPIASPQPKPYIPRVVPKERLEHRRKLAEVVRSKYKNSGGIPWSEVSWHELYGLQRDGNEAAALLAAGPANRPNTSVTVGEVLGVKRIDEIIAALHAEAAK